MSVGFTNIVPGSSGYPFLVHLDPGSPPVPREEQPLAERLLVTPRYVDAAGIALLAGTDLRSVGAAAMPVAVLSESAARAFAGRPAAVVGRSIGVDGTQTEVIGVVNDVLLRGPGFQNRPQLYQPMSQRVARDWVGVAVRSSGTPVGLADLQEAVLEIDPELPVFNVRHADGLAASRFAVQRLAATVAGGATLVIIVLFALGVSGLLNEVVSQRRRGMALAMAIGASRRTILLSVMRRGALLTGGGVVVGAGAGMALLRITTLQGMGLSAPSGALLLGCGVGVVVVGIAASLKPALRATKVDVMMLLRDR